MHMTVHRESADLAEEWLGRLAFKSVVSNKPLAPRTIERYRDSVTGGERSRRSQPSVPLLTYWAEVAPGVPIWGIELSQWLAWVNREVRARGGGYQEASASEKNIRRCASQNLLQWLSQRKHKPVSEDILDYMPAYEDRASERRKNVTLNPIADGIFAAIWSSPLEWNTRLWIGMSAFMTMRIGEVANIAASEVDLVRRSATFGSKGGKRRTVHYGELCTEDWPMLPHLRDFHEEFVKLFEVYVHERQDDERALGLRWLCPYTEGESRPHRDDPKVEVWTASERDLNRFDKSWQRALKVAGFQPRSYTPHQLRHFAATNLWRSGASWDRIKAEMGHDDEATTHAYLHFNADWDRERSRNEKLRRERGT